MCVWVSVGGFVGVGGCSVEGGKVREGWGDCDMKQGEEILMVC